ncbi:MAG TPA: efflux RND transporter permease subunit [Gemmatimonadales bacterium]|nr:efflux RND transporter permease subunit [Gemmatimonadales bacterium]
MRLTGFFLRHRAAVYLAVALLAAGGLWALFTIPAGIYPEVTYPRIVVLAKGGTFEAEQMTVAVTRPLEEALSGIIGLRRIRTLTVRGAAELSLDFRPDADMQFALSQVQGRLAAARTSLPGGLDLSAERLTPSVFPMLQYQLTGADPLVLRDLAEFTVRPRLAGLPDVGTVEVQGGRVREIAVLLDPGRLSANGVSVDQVAQAINATDTADAAGRVDRDYRQYAIVVSGLTNTPEAVGQIVVKETGPRPVRVADLGTVSYGAQDLFQLVAGNGRPAALVNISRQPDGNTLRLQTAVQTAMDSIRPLLPAGVRLESVYDQAALVRASIGSVRDAMLIGGALAVLVLLLFLGEWRTTAAAALSLPLTVAITMLGLDLAGDSLNLMSLGGLAVAIGIIIDDAVVVVENIERRLALHPDQPPAEVVRSGTDEIFGPVAGSTLTTVVVFAPLGLLTGVVGEFFRSFAIALAVAVLLSLVLAMTLIPAVVAQWASQAERAERQVAPGRHLLPRLRLRPLEERYARGIAWMLGHRGVAVGACVGLLALGYGLTRVIGTGFLPEMDEGGFILDYWAPPGAALSETDRQVRILEGILLADPAVQAFTRRTGSELGFAATSPNRGDFTVLLKPRGQRPSVYDVMDRVRAKAEERAPAVRVEFVQLMQDVIGDLAGAPEPIELKLFSRDQAAAERAAQRVAKAIEPTPGLVDLFDGVQGPNPERLVEVDPARVARLGLTTAAVQAQARAAMFGADAGTAREPDRLVPIRVRLPDSVRYHSDALARVPIVGPKGWLPLGQLGQVRDTGAASELLRENLRPYVAVTGRTSGRSLGGVMGDVRRAIRRVALPAGVTLEIGGQYASQQASFRELLGVLALAIGAVLLLLVAQFGGFRGPLAIIIAVPLGVTGALLMLGITGVPFNVSSFMGLILLVGLIVKNGILLLDAAHHASDGGEDTASALAHAGRVRLRPILMTTVCTLAGLVPLSLGLGAGAELQRPLALAVIGGLVVSTLVTLLIVPVLVETFGELEERRRRTGGRR